MENLNQVKKMYSFKTEKFVCFESNDDFLGNSWFSSLVKPLKHFHQIIILEAKNKNEPAASHKPSISQTIHSFRDNLSPRNFFGHHVEAKKQV